MAQTAGAYDEIRITNGGTIRGTVTIEGGQPQAHGLQSRHDSRPGVLRNNINGHGVADCRGFYYWT